MGEYNNKEKLFSEDEMESIARAAMRYDNEGVTADDVLAVVRWCEGARIDGGLLELVLQGRLSVRMIDGEPRFRPYPPRPRADEGKNQS